ncbi:hypothetical protein ACO0SA_002236 [Hanseniaspora valbyensis]
MEEKTMSNNSISTMDPNGSTIKASNGSNSSKFNLKGKNNGNKQNSKHKSNSNSNINSNKHHHQTNFKKNGFYQQDSFNSFQKLPKSKKNIDNWMNSIYDVDVEDYSNKNIAYKEKKSRSGSNGSGNKSRSSSNGYNNKKTSGHYYRQQRDKLYLSGDSYINANYTILTMEDKNSTAATTTTTDINGVVPFESIERCITYMNEATKQSCPICLSDDISCGRMVNCGHIFCYQCLLQYIDSNEKREEQEIKEANRKSNNNAVNNIDYMKKRVLHDCPLCGDVMNLRHIVPVSAISDNSDSEVIKSGKHVVLQLMIRPKTCKLSLPVELGFDPELIPSPLKYDPDSIIDVKYENKFILTTRKEIIFLQKDIEHLKEQSQLDQLLYNESDEFVIKAISEIENKIKELEIKIESEKDGEEEENNDLSLAYVGSDSLLQKYDDSNAYFYYQHIDSYGNKTFLEGQDVTILKKQFLQYSKFPPSIKVQVQHVVNDNQINSKSMQYLNHLPMGSGYKLIEINLQPQISPELYQFYKSILKSRVKLHEKIKRQENFNKIKGERKELNRLMKQLDDGLDMSGFEQEQHVHKTRNIDEDLPTLANLIKNDANNSSKLSTIENLNIKDYKLGDRVKVDDTWYTLRKTIWGETHFERDKKVILTEQNGELIEMFQKQMNMK